MSIEKTRAVNKQVKKQICSYETQHCVKRTLTIVHAPTFISRWKIVRKDFSARSRFEKATSEQISSI